MTESTLRLTPRQYAVQFIKFTLFSVSAGIIQFLSFAVLHLLIKNSYWLPYLFALILSVLYNFTVNRRFTFKSAANIPLAMSKVAAYYAVFTPLSTWWGQSLTDTGWNYFIVLFGTMVINFVTEFLFCRFVVYRKTVFSNKWAEKDRAEATRNCGASRQEH
ncbi:hypothetical protein AAFA46_01000 [Oscillospiraceae bacterium WX1]